MTTVSQWIDSLWQGAQDTASSAESTVRDAFDTVNPWRIGTEAGAGLRDEYDMVRTGIADTNAGILDTARSVASGIGTAAQETATTMKWVIIGVAIITGLILIAAILWMFGLLKVAGDAARGPAAAGFGAGAGRALVGG